MAAVAATCCTSVEPAGMEKVGPGNTCLVRVHAHVPFMLALTRSHDCARRARPPRRAHTDPLNYSYALGNHRSDTAGCSPRCNDCRFGHPPFELPGFAIQIYPIPPRGQDKPGSSLPLLWTVHDIDRPALFTWGARPDTTRGVVEHPQLERACATVVHAAPHASRLPGHLVLGVGRQSRVRY
jgi:hypothetical protein